MATRTTMNVSLPESMRSWVESRVDSGAYANASDYVRDLIRHDQEEHKEHFDSATIQALRNALAEVQAGHVKPAEEVFDRLLTKYGAEQA